MKKLTNRKKITLLTHIALIVGSVGMIVPFLWMILTSFKTLSEISSIPITIFPEQITFDNYEAALDLLPFTDLYINTILLMIFRVLFAVLFSSMAGYAFARTNFFLKNFWFTMVIAQLMIPSQVYIIPQYLLASELGILNTLAALVFPGIVSAFGTFMLRQFYMSLPHELEEAAVLDGCSKWMTFYKIMAPLSTTALSSLAIFTALFAWKDLMWPLIVNNDMDKMTLSAGLSSLQGQYLTNYGVVMAGTVVATIPIIIVYVFFQKRFIQGIALTGTKA